MIVLDIVQPASVVEDPDFQRFVNMLDPCHDMPSWRTLMRRLPTRDATIHILGVSIYHLFCITIQRCIAQYGIMCNS